MRRLFFVLAILLGVSAPSGSTTTMLTLTAPLSDDVSTTFNISGVTLGGVDVVHVWAWPPNQNPIFVGAAPANLPDPVTKLPANAFILQASGLPVGTYPIVVYGHNPQTDTFDVQVARTYTVHACQIVYECFTFAIGLNGYTQNFYIGRCE